MPDTHFPLLRLGDSGTAVSDVQRRLADVGFAPTDDQASFGEPTRAAVQSFQASRRLPADGIVGPATWAALIEAGWRLGDRVLYERRPWLRGDDVAELQERLGSLGFAVGKVDGIFGPLARAGITEFQRNCGLVADGVAGLETIRTLLNVGGAPAGRPNLAVREQLALRASGAGLAGKRVFLDPRSDVPVDTPAAGATALGAPELTYRLSAGLAGRLQELGATTMLARSADETPDESQRAQLANWFAADIVLCLGVACDPGPSGGAVFGSYFGSARYSSAAGQGLAQHLGEQCAKHTGVAAAPPQPALLPILRETRAVAVVIEIALEEPSSAHEPAFLDAVEAGLVAGLEAFLAPEDGT